MRTKAATILMVSVVQAMAWGLFRSSDPDYWKLMTIALLAGIFLSLLVLKTDWSPGPVVVFVASANALGATVALVWRYFQHLGLSAELGAALSLFSSGGLLVASLSFLSRIEGGASTAGRILARLRRRSEAVTENFLSDLGLQSVCAAIGLGIVSSVAFYVKEFSGALTSLFGVFVILAHLALTALRVKNGAFPSNAAEAAELISYVLSQQKKTGEPPGGRLSTIDDNRELVGDPDALDTVRGQI